MTPTEWKNAVRSLVAHTAPEGDGLDSLLDALERIDVNLDAETAEDLLGLVAETLERRARIDEARVSAERSLDALRASSARLMVQLARLREQVLALRQSAQTEPVSPFRQYVGPPASA